MADLLAGEPGTPYATRWANLKADSQIWANGSTAQEFTRGALHSMLVKELYCSSSEALMDRAAKSFVWGQHYTMALIDRIYDVGRVIEHLSDVNSNLRLEVLELKNESGSEAVVAAEQRTSELGEEVDRLKAELKESQAHVQTLDDELLTLSQDVESAKTSAWAPEEILKEERLALLEKIKGAIAEYKSSPEFERGLQRTGQVMYEFGYRVAFARFRARYPNLELESDLFAD